MNPQVQLLQIGSFTEQFNQRLSEVYSVYRLWEQTSTKIFNDAGPNIDIIVTSGRYGCSADIMRTAPNLKAIVSFGVGYDPIDMDTARELNIAVSNTPDVLNDCVADLAMGLMLASAQNRRRR